LARQRELSITRSNLGITFQAPQYICRDCARALDSELLGIAAVVVPLNMRALSLGVRLTISADSSDHTVRQAAKRISDQISYCQNGHKRANPA
jgi:hypothetical protein